MKYVNLNIDGINFSVDVAQSAELGKEKFFAAHANVPQGIVKEAWLKVAKAAKIEEVKEPKPEAKPSKKGS